MPSTTHAGPPESARPTFAATTGPESSKAVLARCPELGVGRVRSFGQILTERQGERLPQ
ncbi:hypothetical protein [Streptomyces sp. NPDC096033]|uniref:hypothetical protein n=1 Tax=Streptomyces sp. NPDC096033 TaxID=3366071 RepID=UPI003801EB29